MEELLLGALVKGFEFAPAVLVLIWVAWRADSRAQQCMERLFGHLDDDH